MDINNNTIEVKSHSSKIIRLIPSRLYEPITLINKIKGFESIDDYVIDVIKRVRVTKRGRTCCSRFW